MVRLFLLIELKRKTVELSLIDREGAAPKTLERKVIEASNVTKEQLKGYVADFLEGNKDAKKIERKLVVGCFLFEDAMSKALDIKLSPARFNGAQPDGGEYTFIDKHELICLNDYTKPSSFFEFNQRPLQSGHRGLIVSIGNHLQVFEEHVKGTNGRKEIIRLGLGSLSFSPHTEQDHEFSLFIRRDGKRTVKYTEFLTKAGFKLCYLFLMQREHGDVPKEPTFKELLTLIQNRNAVALKTVEYFVYLLAHFLYAGLILLMLNKELILTGNFLRKVIVAFGNDERVRKVFLDNLVLAHHVKHTFDSLRMSLQTNINDLVVKSALENF